MKDHSQGLTGLNVGQKNKLVNNVISKKALDNYNNNLRGDTLDGSTPQRKYKFQPSDKNFAEENMKKLEEIKRKKREEDESKRALEEEQRKKDNKKLRLDDVINNPTVYKPKAEKLNPMEKVERLINATRETTATCLEGVSGVTKVNSKKKKDDNNVSNNELAMGLLGKKRKNRSTTPVKTNAKKNLDLELKSDFKAKKTTDMSRNRNFSNERDKEKDKKPK
mmetsp:Transcript_66061/g.142601  ORF Transcript_66061/g.142601 Transcript_66061/m.142601 type:complete len:222 (+) Transcript_66061:872-1537(+)